MEIVPLSVPGTGATHSVGLPYNRRNVEEWSRLDSITGMMEKAKIETDRWSASNSGGKHNFAKVVDSRERNMPDGSMQQKQRKQMEMFQSMIPGGSMQVIRTQTVTSSSSSSWSSGKAFGELQLPVNPLDLSSQKTKGSVGRSGSISGRRPPSRPRSLAAQFNDRFADLTAECHRMHEEAKARVFGKFANGFAESHEDPDDDDPGGVVITEIVDSPSDSSSQKTNLNRQKSCSNENVNDDTSPIQRSSKFRRSLQIPKTTITDDIPDWTNGKSLKERAAEIENLLRRGSTTSSKIEVVEKPEIVLPCTHAKSSFVTAETLQEVRDRLRKSSNSDTDGKDDGIVADSICVKDFVTGFEGKSNGKNTIANGYSSLSYRSNRSSLVDNDWIRRRKSYGFEKVEPDPYEQSNGESSADSGLGNTSETSSKFSSPFRRFLNEPISEAEAAFTRKSPLPSRERASLRCNQNPWLSQLRGTKLMDRDWSDGTPEPDNVGFVESPKIQDSDVKSFDFESSQKKQKKVEFCKTEVHFTAEPGRFHIVETDGKPPASALLRRSRRKGGRSSPPHNPLGLPEVKFGDSLLEKELLGKTSAEKIDSLSRRIETELKELSKIADETPIKEQTPVVANPILPKLYDLHEEDPDLKPRSILKGFRNSFHAGDGIETTPVWNSTVVLRNKLFEDVKRTERKSYSSDGESELQIRFRNLKKLGDNGDSKQEPVTVEVKRRSFPDEVLLNGANRITAVIQTKDDDNLPSVAERIKQAEQTYSSKIDFRSGEATVLQNGTHERKKDYTTWPQTVHQNSSYLDKNLKSSNPSVKRIPSKDINTTTTRISINIPCEAKPPLTANKNKPTRSCSFGPGSQRCADKPQSASLVLKTLQDSDVLRKTKPVHEMIHKFDSLARPVKPRDQRRRTMPINYKTPQEYTHADLEEELRSFTENLDKDFKDIYEEEIGSLKGSCRDIKMMFEQVAESVDKKDKYGTLPLANSIKKKLSDNASSRRPKNDNSARRGNIPRPILPKSHRPRSNKNNGDSDDSDLLADEEVRSYMSAGHAGSESDDPAHAANYRKKSFERIRLQFKRLEARDHLRKKDAAMLTSSTPIKPTFVEITPTVSEPHYAAPPKVASISLRYEDDPVFKRQPKLATKNPQDNWDKISNSSSNMSDSRRERISYLKGPSLSEKYSKTNSSLDNLFEGSALQRVKEIQENLRNSFRSSRSSRFRQVAKDEPSKNGGVELTLDELSKAADDMVVAANGLTDDSLLSSSEDERRSHKVIAKSTVGNLTTISEGHKTTTTSDSKRASKEKSLSSRATRLMQRASNREAAIAQRSSSEDIPSNVEQVKKKITRRPRPAPVKVDHGKEETPGKVDSRPRARGSSEKEASSLTSVPRERSKTVSSAAKEVGRTSSKSSQLLIDRTERTKPSERRQLLTKADAIAEQSIRSKRTVSSHSSSFARSDPNRESLTKRRTKINLRKVEAARVSQAV